MKKSKNLISNKIILLFFLFVIVIYSQSQETIDWPSLADSPWPVLRGDAQGTGRSQYTGPTEANVVWTADLPFGIIYGPTIGYDDILYFGTNSIHTSDTLSPGNFFYAYNPEGTQFWKYNNEFWWPNWNPPIVTKDSTIYFGSNAGYLYALDYYGNLKWEREIDESRYFRMNIATNGDLYVTCTDTLRVISPDGEIKLKKYFEGLAGRVSFSTGGSRIYFRSLTSTADYHKSYLYCTDLSGNVIWSQYFKEGSYGQPAIDNQNNIYVFGDDSLGRGSPVYLFSFDKEGNINWKYTISSNYTDFSAPTLDINGNIIFHCWDDGPQQVENKIISVNQDGEKNWEYIVREGENMFENASSHGLVSDAEGNIYFGSTGGTYFWALNNKGELMWEIPLNGYEFDSSPAIGSDGTLYIATQKSSTFQAHKNNLFAVRNSHSTAVKNEKLPEEYKLEQNYPNPFNPSTNIKFTISSASIPSREGNERGGLEHVSLIVYDILGREVTTLLNEHKSPGTYEINFNAEGLQSGVYFYRVQVGKKYEAVKKMIFLK